MFCSRCGNSDPNLFGFKNGKYYCRACLKYNGKNANINKYIQPKIVKAKINYCLSKKQENCSFVASQEEKEIYIDAVCGSGKTEIVFSSIEKALASGQRVGFVIPRREVVKEIYDRLKEVYTQINISLVYGGHNEYLDGDIICLTCHQAYRYKDKFGLVILDEYDAFPLKGDQTLLNLVKNSSYNKIIYLSATFTKDQLFGKKSINLNRRYHNFDIPVPKIIHTPKIIIFKLFKLIKEYNKTPLLIFFPTIKLSNIYHLIINIFHIKNIVFTSKSKNKETLLKDIKQRKHNVILCTTILERGITIKNVNIIVMYASHSIFDVSTLIQISGRAGRKVGSEKGKVFYLDSKISSSMNKSIEIIVNKNNGIT